MRRQKLNGHSWKKFTKQRIFIGTQDLYHVGIGEKTDVKPLMRYVLDLL